jgi:hypothetical protein
LFHLRQSAAFDDSLVAGFMEAQEVLDVGPLRDLPELLLLVILEVHARKDLIDPRSSKRDAVDGVRHLLAHRLTVSRDDVSST